MAKKKQEHFNELAQFPNVFQPNFVEALKGFPLKGLWNKDYFKNNNPIILELGCGKGEYTVNQALLFPQNNYIGIDIKGARIWRGSKTAVDEKIKNIAFVRTQINLIEHFFSSNEVQEIWITFPDPQLRQCKENKRLTSPFFLNKYNSFLQNNGVIHLKTDSIELYNYTLEVINANNYNIIFNTNDLYSSELAKDSVLSIKTFYESIWLKQGKKITYIKFQIL